MLFNSFEFLVFFVLVYALYLILQHRWQNRLLLAASCIFYGAWDVRFLGLMFVSITTDYFFGIKIHETQDFRRKKIFLGLSLFINLVILGFFKYFNFFTGNLQRLMEVLGIPGHLPVLHIILPVGISFYTFQAMSYAWDIYRGEIKPVWSYSDYALFVTYFPQLVAGPIMRAKDLITQILNPRSVTLSYFFEGCYWILLGLFQKIYVADNLGLMVDRVFEGTAPLTGGTVLLALYAFAFQIYGDFAGYSNMAKGLGKCMGFEIMTNFNLPYFSKNPVEFWQRWHISLSTWLRDYVYIPFGGNRGGSWMTYRNLMLTMLLGGLWHGASWVFVLWGAYHGALLIAHRWRSGKRKTDAKNPSKFLSSSASVFKMVIFFHLICLGWLFFRAISIHQIFAMLGALAGILGQPLDAAVFPMIQKIGFYAGPLMILEIIQYQKKDQGFVLRSGRLVKMCFVYGVVLSLIFWGAHESRQFIYFQF